MAYALFYGEHELTVDDKNRLLIPAPIRRQVQPERDGEAFIIKIGPHHTAWLWTERHFEELASVRPSEMAPPTMAHEYDLLNYPGSERLEWDKQGRVLIPQKFLDRAGFGKDREVTLLGVRDHLELWNRARWEAFLSNLEPRRGDISQTARTPEKT